MNQGSVFLRSFRSYLWITMALVVLIGLYGCYLVRQFYLDQTAKDLEIRARLCAQQIAAPLHANDPAAVDAMCKELGKLMSTRITVILESGKVLGDTNENPAVMENHSNRPEIEQAMTEAVGIATRFSRTLQEERMYVAVTADPDAPQKAFVRTSLPVPNINQTLTVVYLDFLVGGLVIAVLATLVSLWFALRISQSLGATDDKPRQTVKRELKRRFPDLTSDELSELEEAVNRSAEENAQRLCNRPPQDGGSELAPAE